MACGSEPPPTTFILIRISTLNWPSGVLLVRIIFCCSDFCSARTRGSISWHVCGVPGGWNERPVATDSPDRTLAVDRLGLLFEFFFLVDDFCPLLDDGSPVFRLGKSERRALFWPEVTGVVRTTLVVLQLPVLAVLIFGVCGVTGATAVTAGVLGTLAVFVEALPTPPPPPPVIGVLSVLAVLQLNPLGVMAVWRVLPGVGVPPLTAVFICGVRKSDFEETRGLFVPGVTAVAVPGVAVLSRVPGVAVFRGVLVSAVFGVLRGVRTRAVLGVVVPRARRRGVFERAAFGADDGVLRLRPQLIAVCGVVLVETAVLGVAVGVTGSTAVAAGFVGVTATSASFSGASFNTSLLLPKRLPARRAKITVTNIK